MGTRCRNLGRQEGKLSYPYGTKCEYTGIGGPYTVALFLNAGFFLFIQQKIYGYFVSTTENPLRVSWIVHKWHLATMENEGDVLKFLKGLLFFDRNAKYFSWWI